MVWDMSSVAEKVSEKKDLSELLDVDMGDPGGDREEWRLPRF